MSRAFTGVGRFAALAATITVLMMLTACASSSKHVDCKGPLQPINTPPPAPAPQGQRP